MMHWNPGRREFLTSAVGATLCGWLGRLGAILIRHKVLRKVQPRWYLKFPKASTILNWFNCTPNEDLFGRLATIYCNGEPAIELVEIVTATPANPAVPNS